MTWRLLIDAVKKATYQYPELKAITLAQWALESGRGTSKLSAVHNYGGIKWREELAHIPGVSKYFYDEGRGEEDKYYFKCDSPATFIRLYWSFIARAPYKGWEKAAEKGPESYISFIANAGYIGGPSAPQSMKDEYIKKVLSLLPEAKEMLMEKQEPIGHSLKGVKIAFDCGHGYDASLGNTFDPGAMGNGAKEQTEVIVYVSRAAELLREKGAEVSIFSYSDSQAKRYSLGEKGARSEGHTLFVSCHLNSAEGGAAQGTEVLVHPQAFEEDKVFAKYLCDAIVAGLGFNNRGVKSQSLGVLSRVPSSVKAAALVEPFFINALSIGGATNVRKIALKTGEALAQGILNYCIAKGLAKPILANPIPEPVPAPQEPPKPVPSEPSLWEQFKIKFQELYQLFLSLFGK